MSSAESENKTKQETATDKLDESEGSEKTENEKKDEDVIMFNAFCVALFAHPKLVNALVAQPSYRQLKKDIALISQNTDALTAQLAAELGTLSLNRSSANNSSNPTTGTTGAASGSLKGRSGYTNSQVPTVEGAIDEAGLGSDDEDDDAVTGSTSVSEVTSASGNEYV